MYHLIAAAIDSTASSHHALPYAAALARAAGARLELVQVAYPPAAGSELYGAVVLDGEGVRQMRDAAARSLGEVAEQVTRATGVRVSSTALTGTGIADALVEHVTERGCDLMVMTTHDRSRLERWLLGSVAERVARMVHIPVLLVRARETVPAYEPLPTFRHVLVPLDGSSLASLILPHVLTLAQTMDARVTLVAAIEPVLAAAADVMGIEPAGYVATRAQPADLRTVLEHAAEPLRTLGTPVETVVVDAGQPARAIVAEAARAGADVIAMSTHGRGALGRLVAGSVAMQVLHDAPVPLFLYRPPAE